MFRIILATTLVFLAGWTSAGEEALVVEGEAWTVGELSGLRYVSEVGGLVLVDPAWSPKWEVKFLGITGANLTASGGLFYLAGSREIDGTPRIWLIALSPTGGKVWETRVQAVLGG